MRRILAGLALALLIASPVLGKAGASITAPDGLSFGDTFSVTFTEPNHYAGGLWARADCFQSGTIVYRQFAYPDGTFTLGPTPSWFGGAADCTVTLLAIDGYRGIHEYASDGFSVAP